jgi:hypothetical protein
MSQPQGGYTDNTNYEVTTKHKNPNLTTTHLLSPERWRLCCRSPSQSSDVEADTTWERTPSPDDWVAMGIPQSSAGLPSLAEKMLHSEWGLGKAWVNSWLAMVT